MSKKITPRKKPTNRVVDQIAKSNASKIYCENDKAVVINDDCLSVMQTIEEGSIDIVFADPPYFGAHGAGGLNRTDKQKYFQRDKASWAKKKKIQDQLDFHYSWLELAQRSLKKGGSIWVTGSYHSIGAINVCMHDLGFQILNEIVLVKKNAPPNFKGTCFRAITESMIWAKKDKTGKKVFNYWDLKEANGGKQMNNVWEYSAKSQGFRHPATKQPFVLEGVIKSSASKDSVILDPFAGSGTTNFVASALGIASVGIEIEKDYCKIIKDRLNGKFEPFVSKFPVQGIAD